MDAYLIHLNAASSLVLALVAGWAVISPRVRDGVVVKAGLILLALGAAGIGLALVAGDPPVIVLRALGLWVLGLLLIAAGIAWRSRRRVGQPRRRASDWVALDTLPAEG